MSQVDYLMAGSFDRAGFVRVDMALYSTVNAVEGAQCCADDRQVGLRAACHKMYVDIAAAAFFLISRAAVSQYGSIP